jgi:flagellar motility protein MotE (MotC chaperone)
MNRILQNPATVMAAAFLMFFGPMLILLRTLPLGHIALATDGPFMSAEDDPSWKFHNPDIDQWVSQIKAERDSLTTREQELKEWEARLAAESREIAAVTQAVTKTQADFDKRVLLFTDQQKDNAKKELKVIADMSPDGAVAMLNAMPDDEVAQLLYTMKADVSGAILDAMSKLGDAQAKRAAVLTERLKDVLPMPSTNNFASNAGH